MRVRVGIRARVSSYLVVRVVIRSGIDMRVRVSSYLVVRAWAAKVPLGME